MFFVDDPVDPYFYDHPVLDALDDFPLRGLSTCFTSCCSAGPFPNDPIYSPSSPGAGSGDAHTSEGSGSGTTDTLPTPGLGAAAAPHKKACLDERYFGHDTPASALNPIGASAPPPRFIFYPVEWDGSLTRPQQQHHAQPKPDEQQAHKRQLRSCLLPNSVLEEMTALVSKLPVPGIPKPGPPSTDTYGYPPPAQPMKSKAFLPVDSNIWQDIECWRASVPASATTLPPPVAAASSLFEFPYTPPAPVTTGTPFIPPLPFEDAPLSAVIPYIPSLATEPSDPYIPPLSPPMAIPANENVVPFQDNHHSLDLSPFNTRGRKRLREEGDLSPGRRHRDRSSREARDARRSRGDDGDGW